MPQLASVMIRVFPSLEHSAVMSRIPEDNFRTFLCVPCGADNRWHKCHLYVEQNITARSRCLRRHLPIFNSRCRRVRFARFYIVCEEVPLGTPESRPLSQCRTCTRRIVQTWKRHGIRLQTFSRKKFSHFLKRIFHLHFHMKSRSVFLIILLITQKQSMLIATILLILDKMPDVVYDTNG